MIFQHGGLLAGLKYIHLSKNLRTLVVMMVIKTIEETATKTKCGDQKGKDTLQSLKRPGCKGEESYLPPGSEPGCIAGLPYILSVHQ